MKFQQIRGATSIVTFGGVRFLIDPFFAPKGFRPGVPSPHNEFRNPLTDLPLPVEQIVDVDAVIVTHMHHFDHFDEAAAEALPKELPMFVQSEEEAEDMRALGFSCVEPLLPEGVGFRGVRLFRTEALHGAGEQAERLYAMVKLPPEACGVVFKAEGEKTFYMAGDTVWFEGVEKALEKHRPAVVALNAAWAQFWEGTPILMGPEEIEKTALAAPEARFIATHMDAVNHARLSRADLRRFLEERGLGSRFSIPEDGEFAVL